MDLGEKHSHVRSLSDDALLSGLEELARVSRRTTAEVVVFLGEVEKRRLHLIGGYASMFAYCVSRLMMSEDEACRRLEVARLVRRFPELGARLASGQVSLSVAALLKPWLAEANQTTLLDAVSGKTIAHAREALAAAFPQPDVLPSIRKLPTPHRTHLVTPSETPQVPLPHPVAHRGAPHDAEPVRAENSPSPSADSAPRGLPPKPARDIATSRNIEPLSPDRYKLQMTASAELKRKLELARDLMRHALPSGDFATIIERALDLLIEQTMKRRFAVKGRPKPSVPAVATVAPAPAGPAVPVAGGKPGSGDRASRAQASSRDERDTTPAAERRHIPNAVRRSVLARDDLRCSWQGPDGTRCNNRAWLEHDHISPRGKGGSHDPANIRLICRGHNRLAAEQTYGRDTITRIVARRRARPHAHAPSPIHVATRAASNPPPTMDPANTCTDLPSTSGQRGSSNVQRPASQSDRSGADASHPPAT